MSANDSESRRGAIRRLLSTSACCALLVVVCPPSGQPGEPTDDEITDDERALLEQARVLERAGYDLRISGRGADSAIQKCKSQIWPTWVTGNFIWPPLKCVARALLLNDSM